MCPKQHLTTTQLVDAHLPLKGNKMQRYGGSGLCLFSRTRKHEAHNARQKWEEEVTMY